MKSTEWKRKARIADWVRRWNYDLTRFVERRVRMRADAQLSGYAERMQTLSRRLADAQETERRPGFRREKRGSSRSC